MRTWEILKAVTIGLAGLYSSNAELDSTGGANFPSVDLGYSVYRGVKNATSGLTVWKGIRYAAPPVGTLRWQAPRLPERNRTAVIVADTFGARCPQQLPSYGVDQAFLPGDEDCLFLNVYSPAKPPGCGKDVKKDDGSPTTMAGDLPVLVYIHGGGYGLSDGNLDMTGFINDNSNRLVVVSIQYRLGAFGFLASPEIKARGALNAGLLDQEFALKWVQRHISKFGGDPRQVSIFGESAGGGSTMLLSIARGGKLGTSLFKNVLSSSPYLPTQPYYSDEVPVGRYRTFAEDVGCDGSQPVFDCLVSADTMTLQYANRNATGADSSVPIGNWAFIPVTDGEYLTAPASALLDKKAVNGNRVLAGSNANEGDLFVPTITTEASLRAWIKSNYYNPSESNITALLDAYPGVPGPDDPSSPKFATSGLGPATAVNVSQVATGHQQRAYNIYAESTFVCPAYWLADAFDSPSGQGSYYYQYSVPFATHSADLRASFVGASAEQGPDFARAFRQIYGNFIVDDNPSITNEVANGATAADPSSPNPASRWPRWTYSDRAFVNLNQTGGVPFLSVSNNGVEVTQFSAPGQRNAFSLADAHAWEGGRGARCDLWKSISRFVPQ